MTHVQVHDFLTQSNFVHSKAENRISDKDEKLVRDVSPSQGLLQTEEAHERAKRLSPISRLCLIFYKFFSSSEPTKPKMPNVGFCISCKQEARVHEAPHASHNKRTRPPGWHWNCFLTSPCKRVTIASIFLKSKHLLGSKVSWCDHRLAQTPTEAFSEVRVHAGTTQVDFEVDRQPPADSQPRDHFDHHGKENGKKEFRKMKKS